jgi:hypothetical protein
MRACPKCNFQNEDSALVCVACTTTLPAPSALGDVDAFMADKARQKRKRMTMIGVIAGIAVVGGVVGGLLIYKQNQTRLLHRAFYESFREADEKTYGDFWQCFYRDATKQGFALPNNLALNDKIVKAYEANRRGFRTHVEEKCLPKLKEVPRKIAAITTPPEYTAALEHYVKSSMKVEEASSRVAEELGKLYDSQSYDKKVLDAADKWHEAQYTRDFPKEVLAYDHYLRCAIPNFDTLKDGEAIAKELMKYYAAPVMFVDRTRTECNKLFDHPPAKPTKTYAEGLKKFEGEHEDPRDSRAFKDFFRRANKIRQAEILKSIGEAWLEYTKGRDEVLKVATQALQ